ncbi:AbiH family protein [Butyrivibrio sp. XPD2002]|uniref:AbiH family protein n=1 Tax=Butyrivibrio sp. XPD2002 TaxID=1280665 RepID=UPI0004166CCC|nr:AbiH family protein [Butyrivibrio sp. XPD2002]
MSVLNKEIILVIGNGFDIAHGLPTRYKDFLLFVNSMRALMNFDQVAGKDEGAFYDSLSFLDYKISDKISENIKAGKNDNENLLAQLPVWKSLLNNNFWLDYFEKQSIHGEKWIDFEEEIQAVIKRIDNAIENKILLKSIGNPIFDRCNSYLVARKYSFNIGNIIRMLLEDLSKTRRALELYLSLCINEIKIDDRLTEIANLNPTKVISFNYTNTYERVYGKRNALIEYDYLHGKADASRNLENNDIVLGIDEYYHDDRKDNDLRFVEFKKYYQRQLFNCKRLSDDWAFKIKQDAEYEKKARDFLYNDEIEYELINNSPISDERYNYEDFEKSLRKKVKIFEDNHPKHEIFIYGHSLGVTDRDILRKLILNENVNTTIYYHSRKSYADQLKNLIRVIGQNEFIVRTGGEHPNIRFIQTKTV